MKATGSVLVVVLGLLAILAVIGITFVTMSNLDRRTATNFAIRSQFMLAADGAVDYVCHHLIQDLYTYNLDSHVYENSLMACENESTGNTIPGVLYNEPFDYPSIRYDPWLATALADESMASRNDNFSYGYQTGDRYTSAPYGLDDWGTDTANNQRPNNLGFPSGQGKVEVFTRSGLGHGVWIPDLSFPFETGLIRVSVTVLDHGAMVNLNAHGNPNPTAKRYGYFISDVDPSFLQGMNGWAASGALAGSGSVPGLWKDATSPGNKAQMQPVIENPGRYDDHPFTLDEELELRRLTGTYWGSTASVKGRIERFCAALNSSPETATDSSARYRLNVTTVGWTAECRSNWNPRTSTFAQPPDNQGARGYTFRKIDLNIDSATHIKSALLDSSVFTSGDTELLNQFTANICAFRDGEDRDTLLKSYSSAVGAGRQPVFSKIKTTKRSVGGDQPKDEWTIEIQIISPWPDETAVRDVGATPEGLPVADGNVTLQPSGAGWSESLPETLRCPTANTPEVFTTSCTVTVDKGVGITADSKFADGITLHCAGKTIDRIPREMLGVSELSKSSGGSRHRPIYMEDEARAVDDAEHKIRVVFFGDWADGSAGAMETWQPGAFEDTSQIPIRFPCSVNVPTGGRTFEGPSEGGLPPYWMAGVSEGKGFRAFARVGDLNQVLCPRDNTEAQDFWPWVPRISQVIAGQNEQYHKFNWQDTNLPQAGQVSRMNAANTFCVGGPWIDRIDNDGDGYVDTDGGGILPGFSGPDEGQTVSSSSGSSGKTGGRFGGAEIRVAGKINLNTASEVVLNALEQSFNLQGLAQTVKRERQSNPIWSPAQILRQASAQTDRTDDEARGWVENRDLAYSRISNIATVRSDTFSIYGTVQYIDAVTMKDARSTADRDQAVRRSRRFWALVDRSPCLSYYPGQRGSGSDFIRPRVLNFQWID